VGTHLGARRRDVQGADGRVTGEAVVAVFRFVVKLVAAVLALVLLLFALGWVVDVVVDPAEQEITTVDS
jgi:hypothetical protein